MSRVMSLCVLLCCAMSPAYASDSKTFDAAMSAAVAAQEKAASVGGEWRDVGKFLEQAQALAAAGDYAGAVALAKQAESQCHRGYEQMTSQAGKVGIEPYLQ